MHAHPIIARTPRSGRSLSTVSFEDLLENHLQALDFDRLFKDANRAARNGITRSFGVGGNQDNRTIRNKRQKTTQQTETAHAWHLHVRNDAVIFRVGTRQQCFGRSKRTCAETKRSDKPRHRSLNEFVVIDDRNRSLPGQARFPCELPDPQGLQLVSAADNTIAAGATIRSSIWFDRLPSGRGTLPGTLVAGRLCNRCANGDPD